MLLYLLSILATALSLMVVDAIFPGVVLANFPAAMVAAVAIGIVNGIIKPVLFGAQRYLLLAGVAGDAGLLSPWLLGVYRGPHCPVGGVYSAEQLFCHPCGHA